MITPGKIEKSDKINFEFSPNDKLFLVNDGNVNCKIYDVLSGKEIYKINSGYNSDGLEAFMQFHFLSNEEIYCFIETKYHNTIEVWNIFDNTKKILFNNVLVSVKGTVIIEKNDSIKVIDIKSRNILSEYKIPSEWFIDFDKRYENKFNGEIISSEINNNPFLLCLGYRRFIKKKNFDDVDIQILEIRNLLNGETYKIEEGITNNLHLEYSNIIGDVIAITFSNKVSVVSLRTSEELFSIKGKFVDFSPDGSFVITFLKNGVYKVYETYTGRLVSVFEEHKKNKNTKIVFVSDINEIWSTDNHTNLIVWQINNINKLKRFKIPIYEEKSWTSSFNNIGYQSGFYFTNSGNYFCRLNKDATIDIFSQIDTKPISRVDHHILDNNIHVNNKNANILIQNKNILNYIDFRNPDKNYFIDEHQFPIYDLYFTKTNNLIVSLSVNMNNELSGDALVISNLGIDSMRIGQTYQKILLDDKIGHTDVGNNYDNKYIIICEDRSLKIWNPKNGEFIHKEKIPYDSHHDFVFHPTKNILFLASNKEILMYNLETLKFEEKINIGYNIDDLIINESGEKLLILVNASDNIYIVYDINNKSMKINSNHTKSKWIKYLNFNENGNKIVSIGDFEELIISDSDSLKELSTCSLLNSSFRAEFKPINDNFILTRSIEYNNTNYCLEDFWDLEGTLGNGLSESHYIDNGNAIISVSSDGLHLYFFKTDLQKPIYERIQLENNNWLVKLPNSPYYMCSKDASKMLHYVTPSLKVIGFEQLDPVYNRPDIVLDSIGKYFGNSDGGMIDEYRKSWEKRIDRLGLDKDKLGKGEIAVPNAEIVDADKIAFENKEGKLNIKVSANDPKYPLRRFNVYVNEVPLYGSAGISIAHLKKQVWDTTVSVPLSVGENKIQVSVMNELGLENFKYPTYVNYTPIIDIVAKTHYIGIGVNEFKEAGHNLKYCVDDVTDLAEAFSGKNTISKLYTNQNATRENILMLKKYLKDSTTVNDKVIISCSSHGLLDDSLNFYLATNDVDFKNPKARGLKYEELEGLLDGIPARQKLLLLDACNSGENDKTELMKQDLAKNQHQMDAKKIEGAKGVIIKLKEENKSNFKKMNELFVNVRNNTGSVIISAAGGQESALEAIEVNGQKIENGAFTYSVLEYLKANEGKADALTVNKLKQYVENRVEEITNGKQKPTSRQETMEVDWGVR